MYLPEACASGQRLNAVHWEHFGYTPLPLPLGNLFYGMSD